MKYYSQKIIDHTFEFEFKSWITYIIPENQKRIRGSVIEYIALWFPMLKPSNIPEEIKFRGKYFANKIQKISKNI